MFLIAFKFLKYFINVLVYCKRDNIEVLFSASMYASNLILMRFLNRLCVNVNDSLMLNKGLLYRWTFRQEHVYIVKVDLKIVYTFSLYCTNISKSNDLSVNMICRRIYLSTLSIRATKTILYCIVLYLFIDGSLLIKGGGG